MAHFPGPVGLWAFWWNQGGGFALVPAPLMIPTPLHHRPSAGVGIITPLGCSWRHRGHCPLGFFAFNWGLYFASWKLRVPILPSLLLVFSLLVDEATVLSKVKRLNCSFRSREVLNHGFLCSRRVGQREEGAGTDPKTRGPPGRPWPLAHHCAGNCSFSPLAVMLCWA